jgi:translation elongation factor EF-G
LFTIYTPLDANAAATSHVFPCSGMGELHLDVAADRLRRDYNVPVTLGRMMVSYRETIEGDAATVEVSTASHMLHPNVSCYFRHVWVAAYV